MKIKNLFVLLLSVYTILVAANCLARDMLKISWDRNTESDLVGYRVYYSLTKDGPYEFIKDTGTFHGAKIEVTDIPDGTIYFKITAYDLDYNESKYSKCFSYYIHRDNTPDPPKNGHVDSFQHKD